MNSIVVTNKWTSHQNDTSLFTLHIMIVKVITISIATILAGTTITMVKLCKALTR